MRDRNQFSKAIWYCLVIVCSVYLLVGDGGAFLFNFSKGGIKANILLNLPLTCTAAYVARLSMALVCMLTCPLVLLPPSQMVETAILTATQPYISLSQKYLNRLTPRRHNYDSISAREADNGGAEGGVIRTSAGGGSKAASARGSDDDDHDDGDEDEKRAEVSTAVKIAIRLAMTFATTASAAYVPCFGLVSVA